MEAGIPYRSPISIGVCGFLLVGAAFIGISSAQTAPKRCDLIVNHTPGDPADTACLSLVKMMAGTNPIITVDNATRISNGGLRFCKDAFSDSTGGGADIVFIYDNSGSMYPRYAYINTQILPNDTTFYYTTTVTGLPSGCAAGTTVTGTMTYNRADIGTRTVSTLSGPCNSYAGDPYFARGQVIKFGLDYVAGNAPNSTAGAIAFETNTAHIQPLLPMNVPANVGIVKNSIVLDTTGSTNYVPPLTLANTWLRDTSLTNTQQRAIVFISDGAPSDNFQNVLNNQIIPAGISIHGIFMGDTNSNYAPLQTMSLATAGGTFDRVAPNDVAGINAVMDKIIKSILSTRVPQSLSITNNSMVPPQTSNAIGITLAPDSTLIINLDSIIALNKGLNSFVVHIVLPGGAVRDFTFQIKADGPTAGGSTSDLVCFDPPSLVMLNPAGNLDTVFSALNNTTYSIRLLRSGSDLLSARVAAISVDSLRPGWGDAETILLPRGATVGGITTYLAPNYPFGGRTATPAANSGKLEADLGGVVKLSWTHPRDPRETAYYELPGSKAPIVGGIVIIERLLPNPVGPHISGPTVGAGAIVIRIGVDYNPGGNGDGTCVFNCTGPGRPITADPITVPLFKVKTVSPYSFTAYVYDHLGQFVNTASGTIDTAAWNARQRASGSDSVESDIRVVPVAKDGQQFGTGVYILRATIQTMDYNRTGATEARITAAKRRIVNRFGYIRP